MNSRILLIMSLLVFSFWATSPAHSAESSKPLTAPSAKVQKLISKYKLEVVDYEYAHQAIGNGTRNGAKALFIDARPNAKYLKGTIPSSISIPDTKISEYIGQMAEVAKDKEIIVFCGGWGCAKSPKLAGHLQGLGYTDVKLYQAGEPEWKTKSYLEIGVPVVEAILKNDSALLMDARPRSKYLAATIPGALYMNDTQLDKLAGRFPSDKSTPVVPFCGGYNCSKSHKVANMLLAQGYTNVRVFAGGLPAWKKADMPTTASPKKAAPTVANAQPPVFVDGVKLGLDEGTVDGEWLSAFLVDNKRPDNVVLIDVRPAEDFAIGHLKGAKNVVAEELNATQLQEQLPNNKVVIFYCSSGARAMEAHMKLADAKKDVRKVMYFDANISCKGEKCDIEVNEPLG